MDDFKGTRGPYTACTEVANWYGFENRFYEVIDKDNAIIAFVKDWHGAGEQPKHDARLLAAAPELLEALQCLFEHYKALADSGDAGNWRLEDEPAGKKALHAIAKALGKE